ncbi:hypothetical protein P154DRAFT_535716 [Amniculicola lignicola CBS 123094]|uniref:Uncharacterized protein n=1 Tax=Amniculicola lignicola CBS 123094 TaxID=1392246 RepID=A0A6A5WGH7_9PLEO|nr:hypothetical protein P154DRAFT_535716 [Amniculicola lignicola CBS 123094]
MSTPPTKSSKGYAPIPSMPPVERIDDGVEQRQSDTEAAGGDDEHYRSSPPLLSNRSRGNETPLRVGETNWFSKLQSWRPFHIDSYSASWDSTRKPRNWRKITFWTVIGTMVSAIIGLSISTGVLADQLQTARRRSYYGGCPSRSYQNSRLPFNDKWLSSNNRLDFVNVYPPLSSSASLSCRAAWNTAQRVPCHEKIWNRSWDNGTSSLFDPDYALYTSSLCTYSCTDAISNAYLLITSACTEEDTFNMEDYMGPFSVDPGLEPTPIGVITTLAGRLQHTCRTDPGFSADYYSWQKFYCTVNMWDDWRIVDGMNAGNLAGLDAFAKMTSTTKVHYRGQERRNQMEDMCDDVSYNGFYRRGERRFGPSYNSTTCDFCTMAWFERKLMAWKKDEVKDPENGGFIVLQDYLQRIKDMGQRCDADAWDRVWFRALSKYKQSGDLPKDWEGEDKDGKKPCHCADAKGKARPCLKGEKGGFVVEKLKEKPTEKEPHYFEIDAVPADQLDDEHLVIID